jgi:hypothetical protein
MPSTSSFPSKSVDCLLSGQLYCGWVDTDDYGEYWVPPSVSVHQDWAVSVQPHHLSREAIFGAAKGMAKTPTDIHEIHTSVELAARFECQYGPSVMQKAVRAWLLMDAMQRYAEEHRLTYCRPPSQETSPQGAQPCTRCGAWIFSYPCADCGHRGPQGLFGL